MNAALAARLARIDNAFDYLPIDDPEDVKALRVGVEALVFHAESVVDQAVAALGETACAAHVDAVQRLIVAAYERGWARDVTGLERLLLEACAVLRDLQAFLWGAELEARRVS